MATNERIRTVVSAIFVNLAVQDLKQSRMFFESLGFEFDPEFTDDSAACLVLGPSHYAMLITPPRGEWDALCKETKC